MLNDEDFPLPVGKSWPYHIQINDDKLTLYYWLKSLHFTEYQIMKHFSAILCQTIVPQIE